LLTLEGPDGSGKSTQARILAERLEHEGFDAVLTREPGGTALGEEVRQIVLHSVELRPAPTTDALLFNAARAQLVAEVVAPALARGSVVVCDRYADSTLAYQGYGSGEPIDELRVLGRYATGGLEPDLTILFDLPVEVGLGRKAAETNRFETEVDVAFHQRVRDGFLEMAAAAPDRFVTVDATRSQSDLAADVFAVTIERLTAAESRISGRSEPKADSIRMDR
jgi:dTMP kinase